jgi:hypothetical protein
MDRESSSGRDVAFERHEGVRYIIKELGGCFVRVCYTVTLCTVILGYFAMHIMGKLEPGIGIEDMIAGGSGSLLLLGFLSELPRHKRIIRRPGESSEETSAY